MKVIAIHNLENVANLLAEIALITEVEIFSVPNIEKFKEYIDNYKFEAVYILDSFFQGVIDILLGKESYPKAILILFQEDKDIDNFLRLGITDQNLEIIPFNPLALFVKTKGLISTIKSLEKSLKEGATNFDFYRLGLFNLLNYLASTSKNWTVAVKNMENGQVLYSLKLVNGQVKSSSLEVSKIAAINLDDAIPKTISLEEISHKEVESFEGTADFYKKLLDTALAEQQNEGGEIKQTLSVNFVVSIKENLFRERRIYSFHYEGFEVFTQPAMEIGNRIPKNAVFVCTELTDKKVLNLRTFLMKFPSIKLFVPPIVKTRLKAYGFKEEIFTDLPGVETFDFPFLGSKFEGALYFPNGVLITGNLFGSFISKDIPFLERLFLSHFKVFHYSNISSNERFRTALQQLERVINRTKYIFPAYGYAISSDFVKECWGILNHLEIPTNYSPLSLEWKRLATAYGIDAKNYNQFLEVLKEKGEAFIFNLLDDMEILEIVPFEF